MPKPFTLLNLGLLGVEICDRSCCGRVSPFWRFAGRYKPTLVRTSVKVLYSPFYYTLHELQAQLGPFKY